MGIKIDGAKFNDIESENGEYRGYSITRRNKILNIEYDSYYEKDTIFINEEEFKIIFEEN